jgi:hypothetical protein
MVIHPLSSFIEDFAIRRLPARALPEEPNGGNISL